MRFPGISMLALLIATSLGCAQQTDPRPAQKPEPPATQSRPDPRAQPRLPSMPLYIGPHTIEAEMALNNSERMAGMMFREPLSDKEGMLFVFPTPHRTSFWMKNTKVPLAAAYIDPDGVIAEIHALQPLNETSVPARSGNILFVLEMNENWFERHNVRVGTRISTDRGTLRETFFQDPELLRRIHQ